MGRSSAQLFFESFVESLIESLQKICPRINQILAFAEDILIIYPNLETLKIAINEVEFWVRTNRMCLNKQKFGIMLMKKRRERTSISLTQVYRISVMESFKYLRTLLTPKLFFKPAATLDKNTKSW